MANPDILKNSSMFQIVKNTRVCSLSSSSVFTTGCGFISGFICRIRNTARTLAGHLRNTVYRW